MDVLEANIRMHTAAAADYRKYESQHRKENVAAVEKIIKMLRKKTRGKRLLDVGCGMGFITDIAKKYFPFIRGIDATPAMLEKVDLRPVKKCDIEVSLAKAEKLPFEKNSFDVCTAYSVLKHLENAVAALREMRRVLKPGGMLYSGLNPNYYFWEAFAGLDTRAGYSPAIEREIDAVVRKCDELEKKYKVSRKIITTAFHYMNTARGFRPEDIGRMLKKAGFRKYNVEYTWYVGQGGIINNRKTAKYGQAIDDYLRTAMPLTRHMYKYLNIYAVK